MNKSKKIISFAIVLIMAVFHLSFVSHIQLAIAGPLNLDNQEGMSADSRGIGSAFGSNPDKDIREIVVNYIKMFLGFLGMIFVILILVAGYKYMMANGDSKVTEEALTQIKNAIIGLVIILAAYGIAVFVGNEINTATSDASFTGLFFDIFYV